MIVKVDFIFFLSEVLNEFSCGQVSFQILNVVFDDFGFVGDGEVEEVIAKTELKGFEFVGEPEIIG